MQQEECAAKQAQDHMYQIVVVFCSMGKIMLQSGAEVYRVEKMIYHLCKAYGIDSIQCSVRPSEITVSFFEQERPQTYMVRAKGTRLDLNKVDKINSLSYRLVKTPVSLEELRHEVDEISNSKTYHPLITALAAGTGTGAYAIIAGGTVFDFLCGFTIGAVLRLIVLRLSHYGFQNIFTRLLGGAVASFLGALVVLAGIGSQWSLITISALTLLFPGLLFTNALRDVGTGDFVSAVTHAVEAFSIAAALAGGAALVHGIFAHMGVVL